MGKRGTDEGSIYRRTSDGKWVGSVHLGYIGGKRKRKTVYGRTRAEVSTKLRAVQRSTDSGLPVSTNDRLTVPAYLQDWLANTARPRTRASTFAAYRAWIENHWTRELDRIRLSDLTPQDVNAALDRLAKGDKKAKRKPLSPQSCNHARAVLRTALADAMRWGMVSRNAAELSTPRRVPDREAKSLSADDARALLEGKSGTQAGALYAVAMAAGLRMGEALGLTWDRLDLDAQRCSVMFQLQRRDGDWVLEETKSRTSKRTVALPGFAVEELKAHRERQRDTRAKAEWDLCFTRSDGYPLNQASVNRDLHRDLASLGLPDAGFHVLRHSCAGLLLSMGVPLRVVMETLGHSGISLTASTYGHLAPEAQRQAADTMDRWFGGREM